MLERPIMWFKVGALGRVVSVNPEAEINQVDNQSCLCNRAQIKTSETWGSGKLLSWHYSVLSRIDAGWAICPDSMRENNRSCVFGTFSDSALFIISLVDFNLYSFPVISHSYEYNSFQWVLWVLLANYWTECGLGEHPQTCCWCQEWGWPYGELCALKLDSWL